VRRRDLLPRTDAEAVVEDVALTQLRTRPDDCEVVELAACADAGVVADDRADHPRPCPDARSRTDDRALDDASFREPRAGSEHGQAAEARAVLDDGTRPDVDGWDELRAAVNVGGLVHQREVGAERLPDVRLEDPLEHVTMGLQVRLGRAHVEPVAGKRDPEH